MPLASGRDTGGRGIFAYGEGSLMKDITTIEFHPGTKEERLPDFLPEFPYIASHVNMGSYIGRTCPWHWHRAVELFYIESGVLEYHIPGGKLIFPAGSGGLVNSNVLHMTRDAGEKGNTVQLLHIFDSSFIAGEPGSRIEKKYVLPVVSASGLEVIPLYPEDEKQAEILRLIRKSFCLSGQEPGYEIFLREALSRIWLHLFVMSYSRFQEKGRREKANEKIKQMMVYIHEHYGEKIPVARLAAAAFISERECYRAFGDCLHMTPVEYMMGYRLQIACRMLAESRESVTSISHACGLGTSSYFGKIFREHMGCTPLEYRS